MSDNLVRVLLIGAPKVGKRSLVHEIVKHYADGDPADYDEPETQQVAILHHTRTLLEVQDVEAKEEEPTDDPTASLLGPGRGGSAARFLKPARGGGKAPVKRQAGPRLRRKESVFDKANIKEGQQKAKSGARRAANDSYPTCYVVVFDIGDMLSYREAERQLESLASDGKHIILVGNKTDKARRYRRVTYEEGVKLAGSLPSADIKYIESSAKLYQKVDLIFLEAVKKLQGSKPQDDTPSEDLHRSGHEQDAPAADEEESNTADTKSWAAKCCGCCGEETDENGGASNCCARNCKCCPRPVYSKLKKCGKCCTIM